MKVIVDRQTWIRGEGGSNSYLLRSDGKMCCIGFMCKQIGSDDNSLRGQKHITFHVLDKAEFNKFFGPKEWNGAPWLAKAYSTNDRLDITDKEREIQLKRIFAEGGHEIEFIN